MRINQRLVNCWHHPKLYQQMVEWVSHNGSAWLDPQGGVSWIDGATYLALVRIYSEEDLLAFRLTFGDICQNGYEVLDYD